MQAPILLIIFNRPDTTARVFQAVRAARPPRLYIAADGPRPDRIGEAALCAQARSVATAVDWPCEVKTLWREHNLGCREAVSQAIDWFFEAEPEGVVLEDDVLPQPGFFAYCDELLSRYRDDERIGVITGCNFIADQHSFEYSYQFVFMQHHLSWGWASWRRSWRNMDLEMRDWPGWWRSGGMRQIMGNNRCAIDYWRQVFRRTYRREGPSAWDYQWLFSLWRRGALIVMPRHNLITNIGFSADATHTQKQPAKFVLNNPARDLTGTLTHPPRVQRNIALDRLLLRHEIGLSHLRCLKRLLRKLRPSQWGAE